MIQLLCSHGPACAVICIVARIELVLAAGAAIAAAAACALVTWFSA